MVGHLHPGQDHVIPAALEVGGGEQADRLAAEREVVAGEQVPGDGPGVDRLARLVVEVDPEGVHQLVGDVVGDGVLQVALRLDRVHPELVEEGEAVAADVGDADASAVVLGGARDEAQVWAAQPGFVVRSTSRPLCR